MKPRPELLIDLTPEQCAKISTFWDAEGGFGKAMMAQPGNFERGGYTKLKIVILDEETAENVAAICRAR